MADYFKILGVERGAKLDDIKKAYRKLALKYHPDRNLGDKKAEAEFKKISEAYAVLSDDEKRKQYEAFGDTQQFRQRYSQEDIFRGADFQEFGFDLGSIFSSIFGGMGGGRVGNDPFGASGAFGSGRGGAGWGSPRGRGQDVEASVRVSFMDAFQGSEVPIAFDDGGGARRKLTVKIPAGVAGGTRLRVQGKGMVGAGGGPAGDLFVKIEVEPHAEFNRVDQDIHVPVALQFSDAVLGCSCEIATPVGPKKIKIPAGVQPGTKVRLKGLGFPAPRGDGAPGDLYAVVTVTVPRSLAKAQRTAVEALKASGL